MLKRTLLVAPMLMCVGCSTASYFLITGSIINSTVIAGLVATVFGLPTLLNNLRGIVPGL